MSQVWWLGITQGLTEFLPVSSSGHLIVLKTWMGLTSTGLVLESWLHGGTLVAILVAYRRQMTEFITGLWQKRPESLRELGRLTVATIPAVVLGFGLSDWLGSLAVPLMVAVGWMATTGVVWATPVGHSTLKVRDISDLHLLEALGIGIAQGFALWPGLSRSGTTLWVSRRFGLSPEASARFSFWMAIPTVLGAMTLTLVQDPQGLDRISSSWAVGFILSAVSGLFAIKWIRSLLATSKGYHRFGWYTLLAATAVLVVLWTGA